MITLVFRGEPKAVQSMKVAKFGNFIQKYQPRDVIEWKNYIKLQAIEQLEKNFKSLKGPVAISARFVFSPLKTFPKRKTKLIESGGRIYKITKPDLTDNLCKGLIDALSGILWERDQQICRVESSKYYGLTPKIILKAKEVPEELCFNFNGGIS